MDAGEGEIGEVSGKKARVAVGVPYYENLVSRYNAEKEELPHEISLMLAKYDFHFASLSCCFQPDPDCRLVWARFGVELSAVSNSAEALVEKPIAHDIFPEEVLSKTVYDREVNFGGGFKFNLGIINADINLAKANKTKEFVSYEPGIFGYGIGRSNVAWDFKSTEEKGIWGNKRDLLVVIRTPKNSRIKGRFLLGAEIEFNRGKVIRLPIAKRKDKAVEIEYSLSE